MNISIKELCKKCKKKARKYHAKSMREWRKNKNMKKERRKWDKEKLELIRQLTEQEFGDKLSVRRIQQIITKQERMRGITARQHNLELEKNNPPTKQE